MLWMNLFYPKLPTNCEEPPTLYSILESIVNFDNEEPVKIKDLAKTGRSVIFNFTYPLTSNEDKEKFECMILNHFLMRRIGYETVTAFRIALDVKLNEIMPFYNKMFDMLDGWDLFNDGEVMSRSMNEIRNTTDTNTNLISQTTSGSDSVNNITNTTSDRRNSVTPQNELSDIRDGKYISNYDYDTNNDSSSTASTSSNTLNSTNTNNGSSNNSGSVSETITRTPSDKIRIYKEFMENRKSIYTLIFEELDPLFYGLV